MKRTKVFIGGGRGLLLFLAALLVLSAAGGAQAADLFLAAKNYVTPSGPTAVATADFNGDGKPDAVVSNGGLNLVSVLMNNGNGTFAAAVSYGVGYEPQAVAVGDFNGDGKPDIVAGNSDNTISVLINTGDGTFASAVAYTASGPASGGGGILSIAAADLTGDGKDEIVSTASDVYDGTVDVFRNKGNGTFSAAVSYSVGGHRVNSVALGDFDGDGKTDIAAAAAYGSVVSILTNDGTATFGAAVTYTGIFGASALAAADFNSDGRTDLAVANSGPSSSTISVLMNHGDGTFETAVTYGVCNDPESIAVKDLDRDGHPDIVVANWSDETVSILFNEGSGGFFPAESYTVGYCPGSVALDDVDRNGKPDIIVANRNSGTVGILLNMGAGAFTSADAYTVSSRRPNSVAAGDLDGDGRPDIVSGNGNNMVSVFLNNGAGSFAGEVPYTVGWGRNFVALGDIDGDADLDVVAANRGDNNISVLKNKGAGAFAAAVTYPTGSYPSSAMLADIDGDGDLDVALINEGDDNISVLKNKGTGTFAAPINYTAGGGPASIAVGDVNGDGHPDIVVGDYSGHIVSILMNKGSGTFAAALSYPAGVDGYIQAVSLTDVNGDGKLDVIVTCQADSDAFVDVLLNNGNGTFALPLTYFMGTDPQYQAIAVADFDGSGRPDIAVALQRVVGVLFAVDNMPKSFSFQPVRAARLSKSYISQPITISGINAGTPISVSKGALYSINGGAKYRSFAGRVYNGDTVTVKLTSSDLPATKTSAILTIGGMKGVFSVTTSVPPAVGSLTPANPTSAAGAFRTFAAVYSDADGYANLRAVDFLVGPAGGADAIWVRYDLVKNRLFIADDEGDFPGYGGCTPGVAVTQSNKQGTLNCLETTITGSGTDLTVQWKIKPKPAFASLTARKIRMAAEDNAGLNTGLVVKGSWTITP